ncbi:iron-containing alcohol dehydrogenase [Thermanaerothrix sp. 4228-RoL]|uniref:Iron-containing alcohol dehydrogenase n=1 Tax=Thermanaerothrix solaris TaxID=3058434 RepID=A0ABU3NLB9_9CHLR|nr:iron-containing alcohol dehydrogenase [Thermanaerothrix sp. 4228-RoL]MDT8897160.1 iron-containing alcohol dehydrogenase [Thermanaerothrix sp. 4228-RoL]
MWYFASPLIVYGEDALSHLATLEGRRAALITDAHLVALGYAEKVADFLRQGGLEVVFYDRVEPEPSLELVKEGAEFLLTHSPDWIVALGGGSVIDAAKAMWILYAQPDLDPEAINPIERFNLRAKARFVAVPTTSGTGSEVTWAIVLTNRTERRKLGLGSREAIADIAIVDPAMVMDLPPRLTADTGLDALTHAIEGFTSTYHNDFTDGLCLKAAQLVFENLPRAYRYGKDDIEARAHMHYAATLAGLGFGNAMAALAHGIGHALGAIFHLPHGRAVALALPYTIAYCVQGASGSTRYAELAYHLRLPSENEQVAAKGLIEAVIELMRQVEQPLTLAQAGISQRDLVREMPVLIDHTMNDTQTIMSPRVPDESELETLLWQIYSGDISL